MSNAIADIAAERERQVTVEGFGEAHDDEHAEGELAMAAACYALHSTGKKRFSGFPSTILWPWAFLWWRPKDRRRDLVRAAALIVAEIERLDRLQERHTNEAERRL
jgi:hypothetical protein